MAEKFDREKLLKLGERFAILGLDPCTYLEDALRAEMWFDWSKGLADLVSENHPLSTADVLAAPSFLRRLREARVTLRTIGAGDGVLIAPRGTSGYVAPCNLKAVVAALTEMKEVGAALRLVGHEAPRQRKTRFEEMYLEQTDDGRTVIDDAGLPRFVSSVDEMRPGRTYRPVAVVEKHRRTLAAYLAEAKRVSRGRSRRDEVLRALERSGRIPEYLRPALSDAIASCPRGMSTEQLAHCVAYGIRPSRDVAETLKSRALERGKKRRSRVKAGDIQRPRMSPK